ncbi:MAG: trigger factor [Candidatus Omnitrophota bacterium]
MIKAELKELEGCRRSLRVEADPEKVKKTWEEVLNGVEKKAVIPGFRPGKAPRNLIKSRFQDSINHEVMERLIPETYQESLKEKDLQPVSEPAISEVESIEDRLVYTAVFDVAPKVKLESYGGLSLEQKKTDISEEETNRVLEEVLKHNPQLQIQARDLKVRENLKSSVRQRLEVQTKALAEQEEDERLINQLLERAEISAPESLVQRRTMELVREAAVSTPDFAKKPQEEQKKVVSELMTKLKPRAEREVKASFVLSEIAGREKVEVTDDDVNKRIEILAKLAGREKEEYAKLFDPEKKDDLRNQMRIEKTLNLLKRRALLVEKPKIIKV